MSRPTFASSEESAVWVQLAAGALPAVIDLVTEEMRVHAAGDERRADQAEGTARELIAQATAKMSDAMLREWRERCSR